MAEGEARARLTGSVLRLLEEAQREKVMLPGAIQPTTGALHMPELERRASLARWKARILIEGDGLLVAGGGLIHRPALALGLGEGNARVASALRVAQPAEDGLRRDERLGGALGASLGESRLPGAQARHRFFACGILCHTGILPLREPRAPKSEDTAGRVAASKSGWAFVSGEACVTEEVALIAAALDKTRPRIEREAAIEHLGNLKTANHEVWQALCRIFRDADEAITARMAAAHALGASNPAAAPNQLTGYLEGDEDRRVRAEAVAVLKRLGQFPSLAELAMRRDLAAVAADVHSSAFVNLALRYGQDPLILAALHEATGHPDPTIRATAQWELGMLGEMNPVIEALRDPAEEVRASSAETIGRYGILAPSEIAALEGALTDTDERVRRAALTALRRLGVRKMKQPPSRAMRHRTRRDGDFRWRYDWEPLLERWSHQWLRVREFAVELPDEVVAAGWLGYPGATEEELYEVEHRLGRTLPPSYREFLRITNGWRRTSPFINHIWPVQEIDYFQARNQEWIDIWTHDAAEISEAEHRAYGGEQNSSNFRIQYLQSAVQISEVGDAAVYLLNPLVMTDDGEWEAWFFASWAPGAWRYRSFWDLMHAEYASFVAVRKP
jgi:SMI1/KNR4 family protein SUKH-1/HEAT repeat protein